MSTTTKKKASKKATSPKAKRTKDTTTESATTWVEWDDGAETAPPAEPMVELDEQEPEVDDDATHAPVLRAKPKGTRRAKRESAGPTSEHGAPLTDDAAPSSATTAVATPTEAEVLAEAMAAPTPSEERLAVPTVNAEPTSALDTATPPTTLKELADRYVAHLTATGKTESTVWGYSMELKTAMRFLGDHRRLDALTIEDVEAFNASPAVTRTKSGRGKAMPGILKTRRVLRLALVWAVAQGWLAEAPLPNTKGAE